MKKKFLLSVALGLSLSLVGVSGGATNELIGHQQLSETNTEAPAPRLPVPDAAQYRYQKEELSAFVHFGPNTFENVEWGERYGNRHPRELFRLNTDFDADTLIRTLKEAGFKRVIVTAKHHDGFCLWNSRFTDYDVANTDYKSGNGDILEEISRAATEHNMDMGLYLSPWDIHEPSYGYRDSNGQPLTRRVGNQDLPKEGLTWEDVENQDANGDYNEFYNNQLEEILGQDKYGNAGRFVEVWMDGAKGSGANTQNYTFDKWFETIQRHEGIAAGRDADALLFGAAGKTTVRWIGNENGHAHTTTWSPTRVIRNSAGEIVDVDMRRVEGHYTQGAEDGEKWTVPEADARITSGWFWGPNKKTPKTMKQLSDMYYRSVGHNSVLLLNVPPNTNGSVDEEILARVREFGEAIKNTFKNNLASNANILTTSVRGNDIRYSPNNLIDKNDDTYWTTNDNVNTGTIYFDFLEEKHFDVVSIEEAIKLGQRVTNYRIEYSRDNIRWQTFEEGTTIGAKRLAKNNAVRARYARITVSTTNTPPVISEVGFFKAQHDFAPKIARRPDGVIVIDNTDKDISDGYGFVYENGSNQNLNWKQERGEQYLNKTNMWAKPGTVADIKFNGTKLILIGTKDGGHGEFEISIDGGPVQVINTRIAPRKTGEVLFESDLLTPGAHTANIRVRSHAVGIEGAYAINNEGKGIFEIEYPEYTMDEDSQMNIKIKRVGGTAGEARVTIQNNPGSAVQSEYDADLGGELVFADGEDVKEFTVTTKRQIKKTGTLNFSLELVNPVGASLGFNIETIININDLEVYDKEYLENAIERLFVSEENYGEGLDEFKNILNQANNLLKQDELDGRVVYNLVQSLENAYNGLVARESYTNEKPFEFPSVVNTKKILEAEMASELLNNDPNERWPLQKARGDWASNGAYINSLNNGDSIRFPYNATKAGVYEAIVFYRSGSSTNSLKYREADNKIVAGTVSAGSSDSRTTRTTRFEIEVSEVGGGVLIFDGPTTNSPQIDKIEIKLIAPVIENREITLLNDETTGITVNVEEVSGANALKLIVTPVVNKTIPNVNQEDIKVYDIEIVDAITNQKQVIDGVVNVKIPFDKEREIKNIYHLGVENELIEEYEVNKTSDIATVSFNTTHFSEYAIVFYPKKVNDNNNNTTVIVIDNNKPNTDVVVNTNTTNNITTTNIVNSSTNTVKELPKTGFTQNNTLLITSLFILASYFYKKKD